MATKKSAEKAIKVNVITVTSSDEIDQLVECSALTLEGLAPREHPQPRQAY